MRFADLDAVTVDGFGTLVQLVDPVPPLIRALAAHDYERSADEVRPAFLMEGRHYRARSHRGRDAPSLRALRLECVDVFLDALDAPLAPEEFVESFIDALRFEPVAGAVEAVKRLRAEQLRLAVVANWDISLHEHLATLELV